MTSSLQRVETVLDAPADNPLRVAVDATTAFARERRGIGRTLIDLYGHVTALRPAWEIVMFHRELAADNPFVGLPNVVPRRIDFRGDRFDLWRRVRLPIAARLAGADVLHCPANESPEFFLTPTVVTIHDLILLERGPLGPAERSWIRGIRRAANRAAHVLTVSEYSKDRIVEHLGVPPEKVTVHHWPPRQDVGRVENAGELDRVRAAYGVEPDRPYVLAFGASDPRKNTSGILRAWSLLPRPVRAGRVLLVVGIQRDALGHFREEAEGLPGLEDYRVHGFADDRDIAGLLSGATLLVYPSLAEGYGLPILEAFACGTPVLTSDRSSLPEIGGDAALFVDPTDPRAIARGLETLLADGTLRKDLVERGRRRLGRYSWGRCASTLIHTLEAAARNARRPRRRTT